MERRRTLRIYEPFPVFVRSTAGGPRIEATTTLDNIGAGGLHLVLPRFFCERAPLAADVGAELFFHVRFSAATKPAKGAVPSIAIRGKILRVERHPDGSCGVGVAIKRYKFL